MLYVVAGLPRSGTSMMMRALDAGGLDAAYAADDVKGDWGDGYHPNPHGFYELTRAQYDKLDFPAAYDERLVKVPYWKLPDLAESPAGMRVVFMRRSLVEIRHSLSAVHRTSRRGRTIPGAWKLLAALYRRGDVLSLDVFQYRQTLKEPLPRFQILKTNGWPIDPSAAAQIPDPQLCHFRHEDLE